MRQHCVRCCPADAYAVAGRSRSAVCGAATWAAAGRHRCCSRCWPRHRRRARGVRWWGCPGSAWSPRPRSGVAVDRLALIPRPGPDWVDTVGALLDGMDIVVIATPAGVPAQLAARLAAKTRQRGAVLMPVGAWPGADITFEVVGRLLARPRSGTGPAAPPGGRGGRTWPGSRDPGPPGAPVAARTTGCPDPDGSHHRPPPLVPATPVVAREPDRREPVVELVAELVERRAS